MLIDNENYGKGEDPLVVDTLIAETNAGSVRWMNSLDMMPVCNQRIREGDLDEFLLPLRGYSVEELATWEIQKREREEREAMEHRLQEEKMARMARIQEAAESLIPLQLDTQEARRMEPMMIVVDKTQAMALVSPSVIESREVVVGIADLVLDDGLIKTLQDSLIPEGTALASSYTAETETPILSNPVKTEKVFLTNLGMVDSDGVEVDLDRFGNLWEEKLEYASEQNLEQLREIGEVQTRVEPILHSSQAQEKEQHVSQFDSSNVNNITQVIESNLANEISQETVGQSQIGPDLFGNQDAEDEVLTFISNQNGSDDENATTNAEPIGQQDEGTSSFDQTNETFTFEDYERQIQEILNIEKEELLETEAILNARPGADLEFPGKEDHRESTIGNATEVLGVVDNDSFSGKPDHDFNMVESIGDQQVSGIENMVLPGPAVDENEHEPNGENGTNFTDELLETEAILNARPGADGFDDPEEERNGNLLVNSTQAEDLSVLEMDEPDVSTNDASNVVDASNSLPLDEKTKSLQLNGDAQATSGNEV